jgi:hypothetical protein
LLGVDVAGRVLPETVGVVVAVVPVAGDVIATAAGSP